MLFTSNRGDILNTTSTNPTVFVVDDEPGMRKSLDRLLRSAGLQAECFGNAETFLREYDPCRPGCLILDVCMDHMTGLELQKELNARRILLPTIVISGYADVPNVVKAVKGGAVDFLEKPFNDELLLERVQQAIRLDQRQRMEAVRASATEARMRSLTPRETQVMELLVAGRRTKQIAHDLSISPKTADIHRAHVLEKMKVDTVVDLVRLVHDLPD
jgi:two-component system, LuxR family, response regulator FixJ